MAVGGEQQSPPSQARPGAPPSEPDLLAEGTAARQQGRYEDAEKLLRAALDAAYAASDLSRAAAALVQLGVLASVRADVATATSLYRQALTLQRRAGDESSVADTLGWLAHAALLEGDEEAGRAPLEEALAIHRRRGDRVGEAGVLVRMGRLAFVVNDFDGAEAHLGAALAIQEETGAGRDAAASLASLGFLHYLRGDNHTAEGEFRRAVEIRDALGDRRGAAVARVGLANSMFLRTDPLPDLPGARALALEAIAVHAELGASLDEAWAAYVAGEIERRMGLFDQAHAHATRARELYAAVGDDKVGLAYYTLAELARVRHDHATAAAYSAEALRYARKIGTGLQISRSLESMAASHRAGGRPELAARLHGAAEILRERMGISPTDLQRQTVSADVYAIEVALGPEAAAAARQAGRLLTVEEAVRLALGDDTTRSGAEDNGGGRYVVRLMGGFSVLADGRALPTNPGLVDQVVKVTALSGALHVEELAELLWPDGAPGIGRRRLNNVLSRLRRTYGDVVERHEDMVQLAADVAVDLDRFLHGARRALAAGPEAEVLRRDALDAYGGDVLPADRFETWAAVAREQARGLALRLLDRLAEDAARRGAHGEAADHLERAAAMDPYDDDRWLRLARTALTDGRPQRAADALRRGSAARAELGLPPLVEADVLAPGESPSL